MNSSTKPTQQRHTFTPTPNRLPKSDFHEAHGGRNNGNKIHAPTALKMSDEIIRGLASHALQMVAFNVEPYTYKDQAGIHVTAKVQNNNPDAAHLEPNTYSHTISQLWEDISQGHREIWGGEDRVIAWVDQPRMDEYHFYMSGNMPA